MPQFLIERPWAIDALLLLVYSGLALFLVWAAMYILGRHFKEFLEFLAAEREDYKRGRNTMGSLNWKCVSTLTIFGFLIIVALEFEMVFGALKKWLGTQQVEELHKVADITNFFFALAIVMVVSVLAVCFDPKR